MRLRAIDIRNWACIKSLSLAGLRDGVSILFGPNGTGKSNLVRALRACLFDLDHSRTSKVLEAARPWRTQAVPQISVEFEQNGATYRITKAFSKSKEGFARLERKDGGEWTVLEQGKEASRKTRELLGVERSEAGAFQMLWLNQGEYRLPSTLDPDLGKALVALLGSLITRRDVEFQERVSEACKTWFTETMKEKKNSPLSQLATRQKQACRDKEEIEQLWTATEEMLNRYNEIQAQQPELAHNLERAKSELEAIQLESQGVRERQKEHEGALKLRDKGQQIVRQLEERLAEIEQASQALAAAEQELEKLRQSAALAHEQRARAEEARSAAQSAVEEAERLLHEHQRARESIDDRQRAVLIRANLHSLEETIRQTDELEKQQAELQAVKEPAVTDQQLRELRDNRRRAAKLAARLEAEEIEVQIQAIKELDVEIASDGEKPKEVRLDAAKGHKWTVRQHAEFKIGELATIRVGRKKEDANLDAAAKELEVLDKSYRAALEAAELGPDDPRALDTLAERVADSANQNKRRDEIRQALLRLAPQGAAALQSQLQQKQNDLEELLTRRPELRDWEGDQAGVDRLKAEFDAEDSKLKSAVQAARLRLRTADSELHAAATEETRIRDGLTRAEAMRQAAQTQLGNHDQSALAAQLQDAQAELAAANERVRATTLTDAEQAIEARLQEAARQVEERDRLLNDNRHQMTALKTKLEGTEGLHQKRIHAEQAVHDLTQQYAREKLYAEAHKHLKELFEQVREEQVGRMVGPINDRVMPWIQRLGLTGYAALQFGEQLLPDGLLPVHSTEAVGIDSESFGTIEQLSLLVRLAVGGLLAAKEPQTAILDDPLGHADFGRIGNMLEIIGETAVGRLDGKHPAGPLQIFILTCHPERFEALADAQRFDLAREIQRGN